MASDVIDDWEILNELATKVRNADILTITERGVTTQGDTGTFSGASEFVINRVNVRNIRSVVVDGDTLIYGTDYTVDYTFLDTTVKCKITFVSSQTGDYTITYDYGTDKIFPDQPQDKLNISSFPRIALLLSPSPTRSAGHGNNLETDIFFSTVVYDVDRKTVENFHKALRSFFIDNWLSFVFMKGVIRPVGKGVWVPAPGDLGKKKVFMKNQDYVSLFNYERN